MIALLLCLSAQPALCSSPSPTFVQVTEDPKEEYKRRRDEAGKDEEKLWELYEWCEAFGLGKEGRSCLRAIIKVNPDHKPAREGLGHLFHDGKWFKSQKKLDAYKKKEELRRAEEEGLVKYEGEWVPMEDVPFLKKGLTRNDEGEWIDAETLRRTAEGWKKQDLVWIAPEDQAKVDSGLWKCDEEWLSLDKANEYHSKLGQWWVIPSDYFTVYSTCSREVVMKAIDEMDRAFRELSRIYGRAPKSPVPVFILRSQDQYGSFATGSGTVGDSTEIRGLSSIHYAFFADIIFLEVGKDVQWLQSGAGYWDAKADQGALWGTHSVRHAAGQSFSEAIDPSPESTAEFAAKGSLSNAGANKFYAEKKVPEWFRMGAVTYSERYFVDNLVASGGNPYWPREWSIQNILNKGGLDNLKAILEGELSAGDPATSLKLMNQLGLVMAFVLDGKEPELKQAHAAVKAALKSEKDATKEFKALAKMLIAKEEAFRKFAGV